MRQALRPYAFTGITVVGAGLIVVTPLTPPLPGAQFHAVQLSAAADPFSDIGNLFSDLTGAVSSGSAAPAAEPSSLLTPYIDLFTTSFGNLEDIGSKFLADPLPFVQDIIANPSLIADLPSAIASTLSDPATITTDLTSSPIMIDILLGAPLVIGLGDAGPLATSAEAFETYFGQLSSGDPTTVLTALIDGPADIANAYLNGSDELDVLGTDLPLLNGILVPDTDLEIPADVNVVTLLTDLLGADTANSIIALLAAGGITVPTDLDVANISVGPFGGLADGLINYVPEQIAAALTGSSGDLGSLGNLLDPSTLVGDLTSLLTGSAATELPAGLAADLVPNLAGLLVDPLTLF